MNIGDTVYYRDKTGAHFGHLVERGYKWAFVQMGDKRKRVPVEDVKSWPPPRTEVTTSLVKRGR